VCILLSVDEITADLARSVRNIVEDAAGMTTILCQNNLWFGFVKNVMRIATFTVELAVIER